MSDQHNFSPVQPLDENGFPVPFAQARFYTPGTQALVDVYADQELTIAHPTPLLANGAGVFPAVWRNALVRAEVKTPLGVMLPGYPMEYAMRSFGGTASAESVSFVPTGNIEAVNVQDAIEISDTRVRDYIDGIVAGLPFQKKATAIAEQLMTSAASYTLLHDLGAVPSIVQVRLVCVTAEFGYTPGYVYGPVSAKSFADGSDTGISFAANATNIRVVIGAAGVRILRLSDGTRQTLTPSNWRLRVEAWK
jgi:hypothetical protein